MQKSDPKSQVTFASAVKAARHGVTPRVLARFLALGLPGGVMMGVDAASFDVTTIMASVLGKSANHTLTIAMVNQVIAKQPDLGQFVSLL